MVNRSLLTSEAAGGDRHLAQHPQVLTGVGFGQGSQEFAELTFFVHARVGRGLKRVRAERTADAAAPGVGVEGHRTTVIAEVPANGFVCVNPLDLGDDLPAQAQILTLQKERGRRPVQRNDDLPRPSRITHQPQVDARPVPFPMVGADTEEVDCDEQCILYRHTVGQRRAFQITQRPHDKVRRFRQLRGSNERVHGGVPPVVDVSGRRST
ncbi:hypothetical protein [Streptomyces sp. NPDC000405]|uniref:hypothetical protein n=1 Tax=Streptomyces sp. NPDC000405 TaxID=3161033 RepID=UPI00398CFBE6